MTTMEPPPLPHPNPEVDWGPYEVRPSPRELLFVTLGSSVVVASALAIPDAFAILPGSVNTFSWAVRVIGLWTAAYVLWAVGFLAILHITRMISGGIRLDSEGIKLWRFGKKIHWKDIVATTIVERKNFSRLLLIPHGALELTLHVAKPNGRGLTVKKIPSFQYSPQEFASLYYYIGKRAFHICPAAIGVYMFKNADADILMKASQEGRIKRIALSTVITCSLILFLARSAATNYTFNMGNVYFRQGKYEKAVESYTMSTSINPFFPPAWDRLARANLRAGDPDSAVEHWKRALKVKPDFVESKLGLSVIYMRRWQLAQAEELIRKSVKLAQKDEAAYINLAQINSLMGDHRKGIAVLEQVVAQSRGREAARCLLAQCFLRAGDSKKAAVILSGRLPDQSSEPFYKLVSGELAMMNGNLDVAEKNFDELYRGDKHPDLILDIAKLKFLRGDLSGSERMLQECQKKQTAGRTLDEDNNQESNAQNDPRSYNPWISFYRAAIAFKRGQKFDGSWMVEQALKTPYADPSLLASCALLLLENGGAHDRATALIDQAAKLDPDNGFVKRAQEKLRLINAGNYH